MTRLSKLPPRIAAGLVAFGAACGGGGGYDSPTSPAPGPTTVVVEVRDYEFFPKSIQVNSGDTVTWRLVGSDQTHSVTAMGGVFASGFVFTAPGATFTRTFGSDDSGKTFEYWCENHHASHMMQGSVRVGANAPPPGPGY